MTARPCPTCHGTCVRPTGEESTEVCHRCNGFGTLDLEPAESPGYFVAPDADGNDCIWRENHDRPDFPQLLMMRPAPAAKITDAEWLLIKEAFVAGAVA